MTARFVVTVLLGSLLLPGPADFASLRGQPQRCAGFCRVSDGGKFDYRRHLRYVYDYRADTISSVSGVGKNESRLHLSATVEIRSLSKCDFVMQLHNVLLEESSLGNISLRNPVSQMEDFSHFLQRAPLKFSFQDGRVEELCASDEDMPWVLNVKRGILSAFQNSMDDFEQKATVLETDVTGTCDTEYTASSVNQYPVIVTKIKDLTSCDHHYTGSHSIPSVSYNRGRGLPFVKSEQKCEQRISENNVLEKSICEEIHLLRPFSNGDNGVVTKVLQMLMLRNIVPASDEWNTSKLFLTKTTMLYQQPAEVAVLKNEESTVTSLLKRLEGSVRHGVDATTPEIFSQLVAALEATGYPQLAKIFSHVHNPVQRKFLLDAMPYVHTADGFTVVMDLFRSGEIAPEELDSWLTSLSFQKKPTLNMLAAVSALLDSHPRQNAVLGISSMVHNYCQLNSNCRERQTVQDLVWKVEKLLRSDCRVDSTQSAGDVIVALKGIGNMGLTTSGELLTKCHQKENPVEVRLAAIAATRRMPCLAEQQQLIRIYSDASEDVEVRIAAYQSVMRCPSYDTLALVKSLLLKEEVNQVGSYVWTHLSNLRGTKSRWKQSIKELLLDDFLQKKFNTDARKFSRNYELSALLASPDLRASAEADIVFTPASFLPRSVALNLTVDLFGESLNLLDLGARAEGFEGLLEDLLGPGASSSRKARDVGEVDSGVSELKAGFETRRKIGGGPRGSLYARVLGNEVSYLRFQGVPSVSPFSVDQGLRYNKTFSLVHALYAIPTACGFPLEFSVNGSAAVKLEVRGDVDMQSSMSLTAEGRLAPSAVVEVVGTMAVDAFVAKAGVLSVTRLHTNTYVDGSLKVEGGRLVDVHVNTPRKRSDVLEASSRLFLLHDGTRLPVEGDEKEEARGCSSEGLSRALGMQLCTELAYPRPETPTFPLGGPAVLKVVLFKTDTFDSYQFRYALRNDRHVKQLLVAFDTPGSVVDRKLRASLDYDAKKASLEADVRSPAFWVRAEGKVSDGTVTATLEVDGEELLALNAGVSSASGPQKLLEPRVYLALRKTHVLLDAVARVLYVEGTKYKATLEVNGLLGSSKKVLDVSADLTMDRCAYTVTGVFESPKLSGSFEGAHRSDHESVHSHARVEYSDKVGGPAKVLEMAAKLRSVQNPDSVARSLQFHLQLPDLEEYDTKVRWQLEYGDRLLEHRALLTVGKTSWETAQEFRCRTSSPGGYVDFRLMAMLLGGSHDVDYKFDAKLQTTETGLETYLVAHRSSRRKYTALLRYRTLEALQVTLALPDLELHLDSVCTQQQQQEEDRLGVAVRADADVTYVTGRGVRRTHGVALRGDYSTSNRGKDHEVRVSLDGIVAAQLTGSFGVAVDGVTTQTAVVEASGLRYTQTLVYRHDRGHLLTVTLETPTRKYTGDVSASWTPEETALSVDLQLSKRFTFNTKIRNTDAEDSAELELQWDAASSPLNSIAVQMKSVEDEHGLLVRYRGRHVTAKVSTPPTGVSARLSWGDADVADETAVSLDADWKSVDGLTAVNAVLKTPFEGLESQDLTYAYRRPDDDSADLEVKVRWHEGRDAASVSASGVSSRSADDQLGLDASVAFRSTMASLDNVSLHVTHRSSSADVSDGAELRLDGRRFTADMNWHTDTRGVVADLSFGDAALPDRRFRAALEYSGSSGRLELARGAERRFLSAYSVANGSVSASLVTPISWLKRVEAHSRYSRDGTEIDAGAAASYNEHSASLDVKASDDENQLKCSAEFKSTFSDAATLTLVHGKSPDALLEEVRVAHDGVSVATLNLEGTSENLDGKAMLPGHSVAANLRAGDGKARVGVSWNEDVASLELEGRPGHYEVGVSSSRLPRQLRFVVDHRREVDVCETLVAFSDRYTFHHKLKLNERGWDDEVHVKTPSGAASVTNSHVADGRLLRHGVHLEIDGREASFDVAIHRDASEAIERILADVATPWTDPASLSLVRDFRYRVLIHELLLRYRRDRQVKVTSSVKLTGPEDSLSLRLEALQMRPVQIVARVDARAGRAALRLEWEDKALEAQASLVQGSETATFDLKVVRTDLDDGGDLARVRLTLGREYLEAEFRCPGVEASAAVKSTDGGVDVKAAATTTVPGLERLAVEGSWKTRADSRALDVALSRNSERFRLSSYARWSPSLCDVFLDVNSDTDLFDKVTLGGGWDFRLEDFRAGAYFLSKDSWRVNVTRTSEAEFANGALTLKLETPLPGAREANASLWYVGGDEVGAVVHYGDWHVDLLANRSAEDGGSKANLVATVCDHRMTVSAVFEPGMTAHVNFVLDGHSCDVSASVGALTAEAEFRSSSQELPPVRAKLTLGNGTRRTVGVAVTSRGSPVLDFVAYNDGDAYFGVRFVALSVDAGASFSLLGRRDRTPGLVLHLARDGVNNTVAVVVDFVDAANASVTVVTSLPSWNLARYEVRAGYDARAMPKALAFSLTTDATTPFSLDFTMKRNSVNAFLKSDVLDSLVWTLRGNFNFDLPRKYMDVTLDGYYGGPIHLDAKTKFTEFVSEVELDVRTSLTHWETFKLHGLYDAAENQKTAKLVVIKDACNLDLSFAGNVTSDSGFAALNVTGTHLDLIRLGVFYDLVGKVSANVSLLRNNREHQVSGSFLADATRLMLFLEGPSPHLRTLNFSSNYDAECLNLELLYLGLGAEAEPFQLLVQWNDANVRIEADRMGNVHNLEARFHYANLTDSLFALSMTAWDRKALNIKFGISLGTDQKIVANLQVHSQVFLHLDSFDFSLVCDSKRPLEDVNLSVKNASGIVFGWKSNVTRNFPRHLGVHTELEVGSVKHVGDLDYTVEMHSFRALASWKSNRFTGEYGGRIAYDGNGREFEAKLMSPSDHIAIVWRHEAHQLYTTMYTTSGTLRWFDETKRQLRASVLVNERLKLGLELAYLVNAQLKNVTLSLGNETHTYKIRGVLSTDGSRTNASLEMWTPLDVFRSVNAVVALNGLNLADTEALVKVDVDGDRKVYLRYRVRQSKRKGDFRIVFRSFATPQPFGVWLKYDAADARSPYVVEGHVDCFGKFVNASAVANLNVNGTNFGKASFTPSFGKVVDVAWNLDRGEMRKKLKVVVLVDGERTAVLESHLEHKVLSAVAMSVTLDRVAVRMGWNVAKDAMNSSVTLRWENEKEFHIEGGIKFQTRDDPMSISFRFTSPFAHFRRILLSTDVTTTNDFRAKTVFYWNHDTPIIDFSSFIKRTKLKMTSSLQFNIPDKRVSLGAAYDLNAPTKLVSLKIMDDSKQYLWRGRFSPNDYENPELNVVVVVPVEGYSKIDASFQYGVRDDPITASLSVKVEDTVNSLNVSLDRVSHVKSLNVDASLPSVWTDRWRFSSNYDATSGFGLKGELARNGDRYLAATLTVLPRFVWLEVNTPFSGFENLTAETVLLGGDSVQVARVAARWGYGDALELRVGSRVLDDQSVDVDVKLASPWTGNITILGTYENKDNHLVRLRVLRGESGDLVDGNLVLNIQKKKFSFEMSCTIEDLGSTALDVGYDISEPSKKVYFNGSLDRYTFAAIAEGVLNKEKMGGYFRLETPFAVARDLEVRLNVVLNLRDGRPSVLQVKRNNDLYEVQFSGKYAPPLFKGHFTFCVPNFCFRDVSLYMELTNQIARFEIGYSGKEIKIEGFRDVRPGAVVLRASVVLPFRGALEDASVNVVVNTRRFGGKVVAVWNSVNRVEVAGRLIPDDFIVTVTTPFSRFDTLNVTWRLTEALNKTLVFNGSITFNGHSLALDVGLRLGSPGFQVVEGEVRLDGERKASLSARLLLQPASVRGDVFLTTPAAGFERFNSGVNLRWNGGSGSVGGKFFLLTPFPGFPFLRSSLDANLGKGESKSSLDLSVAAEKTLVEVRGEHNRGDVHEASFGVDVVIPQLSAGPFHAAGRFHQDSLQSGASLQLNFQDFFYNVSAESRGQILSSIPGRFSLSLIGADGEVSFPVSGPAECSAAIRFNDNSWSSSYKFGDDQVSVDVEFSVPVLGLPQSKFDLDFAHALDDWNGNFSYAVGEASGRVQTALSKSRGKSVSVAFVVGATVVSTELFRDVMGATTHWSVDVADRRLLLVDLSRKYGVATLLGLVDADFTGGRHVGDLRYSDDLDFVKLRLDDLLDAQLNIRSDAGSVVVKNAAATHEVSYKVSDDALRMELRSSNGSRVRRAALRLRSAHRGSEVAVEVLSDEQVLFALGASARVDDVEVRGEVSLEVFGSQSSVVLRHRRSFPLDSEVNVMSSRLPGKVFRALLNTDNGSVVAFVGHGDAPLLEALLKRGDDDFLLKLRTPAFELNARLDAAKVDATLVAGNLSAGVRLSPASFSSHLSLNAVQWRCDVPLAVSETLRLNVTLAYPGSRRSLYATMDKLEELFGVAAGFENDGLKADALLRLDFQNATVAARLATPFSSYRHFAMELNPVVNLDGTVALNYVEWNRDRVQLSYATFLRERRLLVDAELMTPFKDLDKYALRLEYENDERKALVALAKFPGSVDAVGLEVDCLVKDLRDFSVRTSLALPKASKVPPVALAFRNKISGDNESIRSLAAISFPNWKFGLEVEGYRNASGLEAWVSGYANDDQLYYSVSNVAGFPSWMRLRTPFEVARNLSVGYAFGHPMIFLDANYNSQEVLHVELLPSAIVHTMWRLPHVRTPVLVLRSRWLSASCVSRCLQVDELDAWVGWMDSYRWAVKFSSGDNSLTLESGVKTPWRNVELVTKKLADSERVFLLSWAPDMAVGLATVGNETHGVARLDLPLRTVEGVWKRDREGGAAATLFWDAARDRDNKVGVQVRFLGDGSAEVSLEHSPLRRKVVLTVQADVRDNEGEYVRIMKVDVSYGPLVEQRFVLGLDVEVLKGQGLSVKAGFVVSHPADRVHLEARLATVDYSAGNLTVLYVNSTTGALRGLGASFLLDRPRRESKVTLETPENLLELRGRLKAHEDGLRALELEARTNLKAPTLLLAELHPGRLHAQVSVRRDARGTALFFAAPHWRRVAAGAFALQDGAKIRETSVVAALNTTHLLWTRVVWRQGTLRFLGRELVQDLADVTHVVEELAYEATDLLREDFVGGLAKAFAGVRDSFQELLEFSSGELRRLVQDVHGMQDLLDLMYDRNDFYVKTVVEAAASLLSSARDTLTVVLEECRETWAMFKTTVTNLSALVVRGIAADKVVSHLQEWFQAFQEIMSMVAGNAIRLTEEMRGLQVKMRRAIKEAVETVRGRLSAIKENSAGSLRDLELEVKALVRGVLQVLDPLVSHVQEYADDVRRVSEAVRGSLDGLVTQFVSAMLHVEEVVYSIETYVKLKAWVKEIDVKELADLVVKIVADSVESIVKDVMQTVDNFVVFVGGVSNASPRQALSVSFIRETVNTVYQKASWLWRHYDVNGFVVDTVKVLLEELDDVLAELSSALEDSGRDSNLADALGARFVLRPDAGVLEYTQRLPVEWKAFNQLPNFEELELQRKPVVARLKDNVESYVVSSYKELTRNRTLAELLPPFPKQAVVVGGRHFVTFDGQYRALRSGVDGSFLLATDFLRDKFSAFVTVHGKATSLTLLSEGHAVTLGPGPTLSVDGRPAETPLRAGASLKALRSEGRLSLEAGPGVSVDCDVRGDVCVLQLSGWFFGRSAGLLGTPDNEPSDDLALPDDAWRLPGSPSTSPPASSSAEEDPVVPASLCSEHFGRQGSPLSRCFASVDPTPFRRLCDDVAVCDASAAYVGVCRKAGVDLRLPGDCVRCESRDGSPLKAGATQVHAGDKPPSSADVVLLVTCGDDDVAARDNVTDLVTRLDAALGLSGGTRYALVGLDGSAHTARGRVWFGAGDVATALKSLSADPAAALTASDALSLASSLHFRDGAAKVVLRVGCDAPLDADAVDGLRQRGFFLGELSDDASVDVTAKGVAEPRGCQRCLCVADNDGVGRLEYETCREEPSAKVSQSPFSEEEFIEGVDYFAYEDDEALFRELLS